VTEDSAVAQYGTLGSCPYCGADLAGLVPSCPQCHGDVRPLVRMVDLANHHFNLAVGDARANRWHSAAEHLAVTLALDPGDIDGLVLLGKVRYHEGRAGPAVQLWREALERAPDREDARRAIAKAIAVPGAGGQPQRAKPRAKPRARKKP
jgi:predicted Zn-dependent protease